MTPLSHSQLPFHFRPLWDFPRAVYAHYFPTFPLSIDNHDAPEDYYNLQFLTTTGENGKHAAYGGYLRSRPLAVPPNASNDKPVFSLQNLTREVELAIARGITGFCYDILKIEDPNLPLMLQAADIIDQRFKIIPMLDMGLTINVDQAAAIIASTRSYNSTKRLADGRLLFSAYNAPAKDLAWWTQVIEILNDGYNLPVAFLPVFLGGPNDAQQFNAISWGVGAWGTATPSPSADLNPDKAHAAGLKFLSPVIPQQSRPKSSKFWEAENLVSFMNAWNASIATGCDLIQCITWNDYSESGQICPCTDATFNPAIGTGFYDLTAYFATWFAHGSPPAITQDVLYFCYRRATSQAVHPNQPNEFKVETAGGPPESNMIEMLAFLTEPARLKITTGGVSFERAAEAGISAFKVEQEPGIPTFTLLRNGSNVFAGQGPAQIYSDSEGLPSGILDMTYLSGSITREGLTEYAIMEGP